MRAKRKVLDLDNTELLYVSYNVKRRKFFGQYHGEWLGESASKFDVAVLVSKRLDISVNALIDLTTARRQRARLKQPGISTSPETPIGKSVNLQRLSKSSPPVDGYSRHQYITYDTHHCKWKFAKAGYKSARLATEPAAVAHACSVIKCTPAELLAGRKSDVRHKMSEMAKRTKVMTSVIAGMLPADLADWVSRCAAAEDMFQTERGMVVIDALWKTKPARDALESSWTQVCQGKPQIELPTRSSRINRMHKVLCKAVELLSHKDHAIWALNCGGFAYASGWLAWLHHKRVITKCPTGNLVLGQLKPAT